MLLNAEHFDVKFRVFDAKMPLNAEHFRPIFSIFDAEWSVGIYLIPIFQRGATESRFTLPIILAG